MLSKQIIKLIILFLLPFAAVAQVTNSSITGTIKDPKGGALEGATITATHLPTGTVYKTASIKGGVFTISNARIGGPYKILFQFAGYKEQTLENITLQLGEPYSVNVVAGEDFKELTSVTVTGAARRYRSQADKTGASTVIGSEQLRNVPNFSRNLVDFTALTPQAGANNSFGGRDGRYNNIQIDGANLNNNFGLRSDPLPGGSISSPIPLDAIEEISVNIAPFDIRQSGFTGAGINAVTKSGTNNFKASLYTFQRTQDMNGKKVRDSVLPPLQVNKVNFYGVTFGGPIIKNKLFFFVNGELERREFPGIIWRAQGGTGGLNQSNVPIDSLRALSNYLSTRHGYNTGAFDNFPNYKADNYKIVAKIDWNINSMHKATFRYTDYVNNNDEQLNGNSIINQGGFNVQRIGNTPTSIGTSLPNSRFGAFSMSFANSIYRFKNIVRSGTFELNSTRGKLSNQFLATFSYTRATRTTPSVDFPFVDIFNGNGQNQLSFGLEPFSYNNDVINRVFSVTNNTTYTAGKHTLIAGLTYEQQYVGNSFMPGAQSYYAFNSLRDFLTDQAPVFYAYTYSLVPGKSQVYSAELKVGQWGGYLQDEINVNKDLKVTLALRGDLPVYFKGPLGNPNIDALQFPGQDGQMRNYSTYKWPQQRLLLSPRVSVRWDVEGDKSLVIRGGTGVFTGRIPFVWLTNMPTNAGTAQFQGAISNSSSAGAATLAGIRFDPRLDRWKSLLPTPASGAPVNFVLIDPQFKFPQIWRTYFAIDKRLPNDVNLTLEGSIATDINAVQMRNAALKAPNATFTGMDSRPRYDNGGNTSLNNSLRRIYPNIQQAIVLENTARKGLSTFMTVSANKRWKSGLYASVAYTYSSASELTGNPGAQAGSAWGGIAGVGTPNMLEYGDNSDLRPHRVVALLSYRKEYFKHFASTFTFFYDYASMGNFSFRYNNDMNNDGQNGGDLLYVPTNASQLNFAPITGATPFSAQQQIDAFNQFINNNYYLKKKKGGYVERNAAYLPYFHSLNFSFRQDVAFFTSKSGKKNVLQFNLDMFNVLNFLNKNWGTREFVLVGDPLVLAGVGGQTGFTSFPAGQPVYRMRVVNGSLPTKPYEYSYNTGSVWGMQLGLRYNFN
ncbi:MAG: carboxypeptidase regulatory-like domain-containing protein [Chitinophagales bacterium]|nr:carboxypeptidase regulatory-like domain-containing protein [Chitinophagales bacterium]